MNCDKQPRLGIFWIVGRKIISYSVPLDRAEHAGGFANYPHGHAQLWPLVVRSDPRLWGKTYDQVPRGRVTCDTASDTFMILVPRAVADDRAAIEQLVCRFGLPHERTKVMDDAHYDPPRPPGSEEPL